MEQAPPPGAIDRAGIWGKVSFNWAWNVMKNGKQGTLNEEHVLDLLGKPDHARQLWQTVEKAREGVDISLKPSERPRSSRLWWILLCLHKFALIHHAAWCAFELVVRVAAPLLLRRFLQLLEKEKEGEEVSSRELWGLAAAIGVSGLLLCLQHHQCFFVGMRLGFHLRCQMMSAIHAKVLRLNSKAISSITTGQVVNLVSNDVRRFDDAGPFWVFLWGGPLETVAVTYILWEDLGWLPTVVGMSFILLLLPVQSYLARYIGRVRRETTKFTDKRVHIMNEVVSGIMACKMYVWEESFIGIIQNLRDREVDSMGRVNRLRAMNAAIFFMANAVASFMALSLYQYQGGTLTMARISYVIALIQLPKLTMANFFVRGVETMSEALVSLTRIENFLNLPEPQIPPERKLDPRGQEPAVTFQGGEFYWEDVSSENGISDQMAGRNSAENGGFRLSLPGFEVQSGELVGICGPVGCGKTSFLAALMQEISPAKGTCPPLLLGPVAYCSQQPWIVAGTLRDNILFGSVMDADRYAETVRVCALQEDIRSLPQGDLTELGERGVNLSGGQKARVGLARAVYSQAHVLLLDDPLSAVDPPVGEHLFHQCLASDSPLIGHRTRLLVTHQTHFLHHCDRVMLLDEGRVAGFATPQELIDNPALPDALREQLIRTPMIPKKPPSFSSSKYLDMKLAQGTHSVDPRRVSIEDALEVINQKKPKQSEWQQISLDIENGGSFTATQASNPALNNCSLKNMNEPLKMTEVPVTRKTSMEANPLFQNQQPLFDEKTANQPEGRMSAEKKVKDNDEDGKDAENIIKQEGKVSGSVGMKVYLKYSWYMGYLSSITVLTLIAGGSALLLAQETWVASWAQSGSQNKTKWIYIYSALTLGVVMVGLTRALLCFTRTLGATQAIHNVMTVRLLQAPLAFFHGNPSGRILNRFSKDLGSADELLPQVLFDALQCGGEVFSTVAITVMAVPLVAPVLVPLGLMFNSVQSFYTATSREVKREEAMTRSPIFSVFSSTLKGLATIRAYKAQDRYHHMFLRHMELNAAWWVAFMGSSRWLGFRLDFIVAVFLTAAVVLIVPLRDQVSVAFVGVALAHALQLSGLLQWFLRQCSEVENNMTSVERLLEYTALPAEPPAVAQGGTPPPPGWPANGHLVFKGVHATYRPGLPSVLRGLSFQVQPGHMCGIAGRTGSGKSSLLLALYRMINVTEGSVHLNGVDVAKVGLDALRKNLAIIPQDPVLFSGTFRHNLDPFDKHPDSALWEVLELVQLETAVKELGGKKQGTGVNSGNPQGLQAIMAECGDNLSVGQKQLACLARAMLCKAKVFCLDEATANVDAATDALIQKALRQSIHSFGATNSALIIAHRLDTIVDCNQIVVLSDGVAIEQGCPEDLSKLSDGVFAQLLASASHLVDRQI